MKIEGVSLFSTTPVAANGAIDIDRWKRHLDDAFVAGVRCVTLFGSTGGNGYFSESEKKTALETVAQHLGGQMSVMMGIGSMTTDESVRLAKHASDNGADAVLAVPLNYWPPTESELFRHYETIAAASKVPVWLYNNPGLAGIDLTPAIVAKLASIPNVVGMKDSSGDLTRALTIPQLTGNKIAVGVGQDTLILEALLGVAPAWFTGLANICPSECILLWQAAKDGDLGKANSLSRKLFELSEIGSRHGIIRVAHTALDMLGESVGQPRAPLRYLEGEAAAELRAALNNLGIL